MDQLMTTTTSYTGATMNTTKTTISAAELLAEDDLEKFATIKEAVDHLTTHHAYTWLVAENFKLSAKNLAHLNQLHEMAHNESEGYC